jgi:hypothetical protein
MATSDSSRGAMRQERQVDIDGQPGHVTDKHIDRRPALQRKAILSGNSR